MTGLSARNYETASQASRSFFELALEDITRAADLFRPIYDRRDDQLGIAIAKRIYKAYRSVLTSQRWQCVYNMGARPSVCSGRAQEPRTQGVRHSVRQGPDSKIHY
jgi:hypothetical protein